MVIMKIRKSNELKQAFMNGATALVMESLIKGIKKYSKLIKELK